MRAASCSWRDQPPLSRNRTRAHQHPAFRSSLFGVGTLCRLSGMPVRELGQRTSGDCVRRELVALGAITSRRVAAVAGSSPERSWKGPPTAQGIGGTTARPVTATLLATGRTVMVCRVAGAGKRKDEGELSRTREAGDESRNVC